ncbi:Sec-independent protein translocase protein TatB [Hyphomicrobium sp. 1Nfss2.1]|uniref:Sec-independent protein translocase protein TatB n=1 Tax=Hyphomicrobium sp. 1Nfss2.1 TaxID=3413936 RepID=UPI003C7B2078
MFDITSSKLLILAIVALIVVGPKDLPILLRTVGKYLGMIRRQAAEFRGQFDEAMREAELDQLKKEFEAAAREVHGTVEASARNFEKQIEAAGTKPEPAKEEPKFGTALAAPAGEELQPGQESTPKPALAEPAPASQDAETKPEPGRGAA